jgi:Protein of unknown function (DUF4242)
METFVILRRGPSNIAQEPKVDAARSNRIGDEETPQDVRWVCSCVIEGDDGKLGTACIYQASSVVEALREHAERAHLQADEIFPVFQAVVVREDPKCSRKKDLAEE